MHNKKKQGFIHNLIQYRGLLIMLMPAIIFTVIFSYLPMSGIILAFVNYNFRDGFFSPFVGLRNFKFLLMAGDLWRISINTLAYNAVFILFETTIAISCALLLTEVKSKYFKKIAQNAMFLPYFISWVVVGAFAYSLLNYDNGLIGNLQQALGIEKFDFYNNPNIWPPLIVLFSAWKNIGYLSVIYIAAISGIDTQIYEAAKMDGANVFKEIRYITIPSLVPTIITMVLLSVGRIFRGDFSMFYNLVGFNANLLSKTEVIDTFVTRILLTSPDIGMASAASFFQSIVCLVVILLVNKSVKVYEKEYALF